MSELIDIITSPSNEERDRALDAVLRTATLEDLLAHAAELDRFRRTAENLYERVRALFFLAAIYRYHLPRRLSPTASGLIPFRAFENLLQRRFSEAIDGFRAVESASGPNEHLASALAEAYHQLGFQTLADQVRRSVRTVRGNQWMFRIGHPADHPLRLRRELLQQCPETSSFPILCERTAVRMDFSHSAWSDIFFLGMDFPEGARVLNVSIDLGVRGRDQQPRPPIETYLRVIDQPVIRLTSIDLQATTDIEWIGDTFDFARDYLGLLKAAIIAAGLVPPGMEGCRQSIRDLLETVVGTGYGIEIVSKINDIPKGSRLAVSTNLLGSLISIIMRATRQIATLTGPLEENDRRLVAARAILGEWLGGSGGGWQDSGGVWPGIKLITGAVAQEGDPEFSVSRGRLMPAHHVLGPSEVNPETRQRLHDSLVLVHGGMAQNVGPILEMVTEHYLLRNEQEWKGRREAMQVLDEVVEALREGDVRRVGALTTRNFTGPLQTIIPWATNRFTDLLIDRCRARYGDLFWGFWMLGGMAGGGMGFIFDPAIKAEAQEWLYDMMRQTKYELQTALPFAMDPVVYDFKINDNGTCSELLTGQQARMPDRYYAQMLPGWLRLDPRHVTLQTRLELERIGRDSRDSATAKLMLASLLPRSDRDQSTRVATLQELLRDHGFDMEQHEQIRADLRAGRIGLAQNRLSSNVAITDVKPSDVIDLRQSVDLSHTQLGREAIRNGQVAVVTLAAGVGSRWTQGAGVCKALHPFYRFKGRHRSFLEVHLAKNRRARQTYEGVIPHVFTTGYLTDQPIRHFIDRHDRFGFGDSLYISSGRSVGLRTIPMVRDLRFLWEEMPQQVLDEQQQKVRESLSPRLIGWAHSPGEGSDYTDNTPSQCMHPVGHWYEIPNLLRNGVLRSMLSAHPSLRYLLLHNIDTLGASVDPGLLGQHIATGHALSFEVIGRRLEDRGGGLARVAGRPRLVEGLAMPNEEIEFQLTYYNSMTTWIDIDQLLQVFGLTREQLGDMKRIDAGIRKLAQRIPTYITLKEVKKRWGHAQEDIYPVAQFEKLWGDMSSLPELTCNFFVTALQRGQQLKAQAQLDSWRRDGSAAYIEGLCAWDT